MSANKLADEVEMWGKDLLALNMKGGIPVIEGAKMLRQQQAEIEMLKKLLDDFGITVNKKPAKYSDAWWKEVEEFNKQLREQEK